jgi:hypothetical protein
MDIFRMGGIPPEELDLSEMEEEEAGAGGSKKSKASRSAKGKAAGKNVDSADD